MGHIKIHPRLGRRHIDQVVEIDFANYQQTPSPVAIRNAEENPWNYTILTFGDRVEGYGLVVPIDTFATEALKRGEIDEDELMSRHVTNARDCNALYIASLATRLNTHATLRSRLVGYTLGPVLRSEKPVLAVAVSKNGDRIAREIGLEGKEYSGKYTGIQGFTPKLFLKWPFQNN